MHATYTEMTAHGLRLANYGTIYVAWECSDYSGLGAERRDLGAALTEEQAWSISKERRSELATYGRMIQHVDEVACPKSIRTLADKGGGGSESSRRVGEGGLVHGGDGGDNRGAQSIAASG